MKKFLVIMLAMLWMSVAAFSQITQEDYDKLPNETRTQIEKITTEKAIKGEIKEVSEFVYLAEEQSRLQAGVFQLYSVYYCFLV